MRRSFSHIGKLIKEKRLAHPEKYSQSELSNVLGYKNGQFISNVERALCSIPMKMLKKVSLILNIPSAELKEAILRDEADTIDNFLNSAHDFKVRANSSQNSRASSTKIIQNASSHSNDQI